LKNGACGLSNLVLDVDWWVRANSSRAVQSLTCTTATFTAKAVARPAVQVDNGAADHS